MYLFTDDGKFITEHVRPINLFFNLLPARKTGVVQLLHKKKINDDICFNVFFWLEQFLKFVASTDDGNVIAARS